MRKLPPMLLLLACALALSGCAPNGEAVKPAVCPTLPPLPENLMQPSKAEQTVRAQLFEPLANATHK